MTSSLRTCVALFIALFITVAAVDRADAQTIGTFTWRLSPYCNVLTLTITQVGGTYRAEGYDNQCGATERASAIGLIVPNLDGSLEFGLTVVTATGGAGLHLDATVTLPSASGSWRDNGGRSGTFVFNPGTASGSPLPAPPTVPSPASVTSATIVDGAVGAVDINSDEVQRRITGTCGAGQYVQSVGAGGTVGCGVAGGAITSVNPGTGLTGGGSSGAVTLSVIFAGPGSNGSVARSDHTHAVGLAIDENLAIGRGAMAGGNTGSSNTAVGDEAMTVASTGSSNTAVGDDALQTVAGGSNNTGIGRGAMAAMTSGGQNTAVGALALVANSTGSGNTAVGTAALSNSITASDNTAIGSGAGSAFGVGSNNLFLGHAGVSGDNNVIRMGKTTHTSAYIGGVFSQAVDFITGSQMYVDFNGKLGTTVSSRRYKDDITTLDSMSSTVGRLRPVSFRYKTPSPDGSRPLQYGLIAEEVDEVLPELVIRDPNGQVESVKYHLLPPLLLAEVQRLERERAEQERRLTTQAQEIAELRALVESLVQRR